MTSTVQQPSTGTVASARAADIVVVALVVAAALGALRFGTPGPGVEGAAPLVWVLVALATWGAVALRVRLHVRGHAIDVTAVEAVVAAGAWVVSADALLLGMLLGGLLALMGRGARGRELVVNLALVVVRVVVTLTVLDGMLRAGHDDGVALGATVVAVVVSALVLVGVGLVLATLDQGVPGRRAVQTVVGVALAVASVMAAAGGLAADVWLRGRSDWWVALLPAAVVLAVAAGLARARVRADGLRGAIDATHAIHRAEGPVEALRLMVQELVSRFDATGVELHRLPRGGGTPTSFRAGSMDGAGSLFAGDDDATGARLLPEATYGPTVSGRGMSTLVDVPGGDTVRVRILREPSRPFTGRDRELFDETCRAAVISFETSQMQETLARLAEVDEMKTAFLTAVSHDLRTPLAVVLGGVLTLSEHGDRLAREQRDVLLQRVAVQGRRLDQMLRDLLDIDRLQRGVIEPNREEVDVTAEVAAIVDAVAASSHPVRVSTEPVVGLVDRGHLSRIVENLVRNAIKYTPAGTPIWVDARRDAAGTQLVVSDAGPGVPEEQRSAIFGAFVRGDDTHPSPGTGVGLDLVRRLAELHGGRAWVDERPGGGARFWVTLPNSVVAARRTG